MAMRVCPKKFVLGVSRINRGRFRSVFLCPNKVDTRGGQLVGPWHCGGRARGGHRGGRRGRQSSGGWSSGGREVGIGRGCEICVIRVIRVIGAWLRGPASS